MARYTDANGKQWVLKITVNSIRRVQAATDEDLSRAIDGDLLARIGNDASLLGLILWHIVSEQAEKAGVSENEFYDGLAGDALESAAKAFMDGLVDFFPSPRRKMLRKLLEAGEALQAKSLLAAEAEIEKVLSSGNSFTKSPDA